MDAVVAAWQAVQTWWDGIPALPDLDLPNPGDPDVLIVVATVLLAIGLMTFVAGWVDKRLSWSGVFSTFLALALLFWVWEADREGFGWISIPEAFVEMVARALR